MSIFSRIFSNMQDVRSSALADMKEKEKGKDAALIQQQIRTAQAIQKNMAAFISPENAQVVRIIRSGGQRGETLVRIRNFIAQQLMPLMEEYLQLLEGQYAADSETYKGLLVREKLLLKRVEAIEERFRTGVTALQRQIPDAPKAKKKRTPLGTIAATLTTLVACAALAASVVGRPQDSARSPQASTQAATQAASPPPAERLQSAQPKPQTTQEKLEKPRAYTPQPLPAYPPAFQQVFHQVMDREGGYVNHPKDKGGPTKFGVTHRVYDAYRSSKKLPKRSIREITAEEAADIYYHRYWLTSRAAELPPVLGMLHFDSAVHHGVGRANRMLQQAVGVKKDGHIGPITMARLSRMEPRAIAEAYLGIRTRFLDRLGKRPSQKDFHDGWMNRMTEIRQLIERWQS